MKLCILSLVIAECISSCGGEEELAPSDISMIALAPNPFGVERASSVQLSASAILRDGTRRDISASSESAWSTNDPTTAVVDEHGDVEGVTAGVALITVTYEGLSDTVECTVVER